MSTPRRRAVLNTFANMPFFTKRQRATLMRRAGIHAGNGTEIEQGFRVAGPEALTAGSDCYFGYNAFIDCEGEVVMGNDCAMGAGSRILTSHHDILPTADRMLAPTRATRVTLGDHVFIGAGATVMAGVTVAERCVIGAGAVLTCDTAPGGVYTGVPARRIRDL